METYEDNKFLDMFKKNKNLIHFVIHKYYKKQKNILYDYEDLYQIGSIGLWKACKSYNESKNVQFSTYATRVIYNEIGCNLRKIKNNINVLYLYELVGDDSNEYLIDKLKSYDNLNYDLLIMKIDDIINKLPELDKNIFKYKLQGLSQKDIGDRLNYSQAQISRKIHELYREITEEEDLL